MAVQLRPVTTADHEFLQDLYSHTHGAALAFAGLPVDQLASLRELQFRAQQQQYLSNYPESVDHLILGDGVAVGRCWLNTHHDSVRVLDIAVLPEFQRRGIAEEVIRRLQQTYSSQSLRLSVWSENAPALSLYRRCGFQVPDDIPPGYLELEFRQNAGVAV